MLRLLAPVGNARSDGACIGKMLVPIHSVRILGDAPLEGPAEIRCTVRVMVLSFEAGACSVAMRHGLLVAELCKVPMEDFFELWFFDN